MVCGPTNAPNGQSAFASLGFLLAADPTLLAQVGTPGWSLWSVGYCELMRCAALHCTAMQVFITNGWHSNVVVVCAKTDPSKGAHGISLFLIEDGMPVRPSALPPPPREQGAIRFLVLDRQ